MMKNLKLDEIFQKQEKVNEKERTKKLLGKNKKKKQRTTITNVRFVSTISFSTWLK